MFSVHFIVYNAFFEAAQQQIVFMEFKTSLIEEWLQKEPSQLNRVLATSKEKTWGRTLTGIVEKWHGLFIINVGFLL